MRVIDALRKRYGGEWRYEWPCYWHGTGVPGSNPQLKVIAESTLIADSSYGGYSEDRFGTQYHVWETGEIISKYDLVRR